MSTLRYHLHDDKIEEFAKLLKRRQEVMRLAVKPPEVKTPEDKVKLERWLKKSTSDHVRDAWAEATTAYWVDHTWLHRFDRSELRFDEGRANKVQVVIENPSFSLLTWTIDLDSRLAEWLAATPGLVDMIEFEDFEFERNPGEPDARGDYKERGLHKGDPDKARKMGAYVTVKRGRYNLVAQCQVGSENVIDVLGVMSGFVRDIVVGTIKPEQKDKLPATV